MKSIFIFVIFTCSLVSVAAQQLDTIENQELSTVTIFSNWATKNTPITQTNISKTQLEKNNLGQDIPFLLRNVPGVVETSDAGAGIGYTGIRVRGSDATRTNVTINGVPLNDSESQSVYWVNMPDFASNTDDIQVQRGAGTSTSGAGAFGATINLSTHKLKPKYLQLSNSIGSFNTLKNTLQYNSGLLAQKYAFDARLSSITSDGYIDRASSNLKSYYLSALMFYKKSSLRLHTWGGKEITYQAWNGLPQQLINTNRTFNISGTQKPNTPYSDEVDNYAQYHNQLIFNTQLTSNMHLNITAHYTKGHGFYENYKANQKLSKYKPELLDTSDIVIRRWLDNHFYGALFSLVYEKNRHQITLGGGINQYLGDHFGKLHWIEKTISLADNNYYQNNSKKNDFNIFVKDEYQINKKLLLYADLQVRAVGYHYIGAYFDDGTAEIYDIEKYNALHFFNPKIGLHYAFDKNNTCYTSMAVANREPNRNDYIGQVTSNGSTLTKAERLYDYELGYKFSTSKLNINTNLYYMDYKDQLVLDGTLNFVGEPNRINVPKSYRMGLELDGTYTFSSAFTYSGNIAISKNKINTFREFRDDWDSGKQYSIENINTDIAYSPNITSTQEIAYSIIDNEKNKLNAAIIYKIVGSQYLDNSSSAYALLPAYQVGDIRISYQTHWKAAKEIIFTLLINNFTNQKYVSNGWIYRFQSQGYDPTPDDAYAKAEQQGQYNQTGYFPQATRNFFLGLKVGF